MARLHEEYVAKLLGGRKSKSSGNQFNDQLDGRHDHWVEDYAYAWDCKSTCGKSIGVTRQMWDKAVDQAHGEQPCIPIRFYDSTRLESCAKIDLVVIPMTDLADLRERASRCSPTE
jgi:hypothetical protein